MTNKISIGLVVFWLVPFPQQCAHLRCGIDDGKLLPRKRGNFLGQYD